MKKTFIFGLVLAIIIPFGVSAQKKGYKKQEASADTVSSITVTKTGIYEAEIGATTKPFEVAPGIYTITVELESGVSAPSGEITVGFVKGFIEPDYIVNPDSTNSMVAYVAIGELMNEDNTAVRFVSFDSRFLDKFQELALNKDGDANTIFLQGLEMDAEIASRVTGVDIAPSGDPIKSYLLVGASLEEVKNPAVVLVAADLIRTDAKQTVQDYAPDASDAARMVKVTGIGYEEMKERSAIDSTLLPYLNKKWFMKVRNIWSQEQDAVSTTVPSSARVLQARNLNKQLQKAAVNSQQSTSRVNRRYGAD